MRILSKKMKRKSKKGVSWAQSGRNRKLLNKVIADSLEIIEAMKQPIELLNDNQRSKLLRTKKK